MSFNNKRAIIEDNLVFQEMVLKTSAAIASIAFIGCMYSTYNIVYNTVDKTTPLICPTAVVGIYSAGIACIASKGLLNSQNALKRISGGP